MELGLSLGESPITTPFKFLDKKSEEEGSKKTKKRLGFCMALGRSSSPPSDYDDIDDEDQEIEEDEEEEEEEDRDFDSNSQRRRRSRFTDKDQMNNNNNNNNKVPLQLALLPAVPVPRGHVTTSSTHFRFPWLAHNYGAGNNKGFDVNRKPVGTAAVTGEEVTEEAVTISSPNSTLSSFHMDFCLRNNNNNNPMVMRTITHNHNNNINNIMISNNNNIMTELGETGSRASDDEENGSTRKKLRLSKDQSAFLEESFKEHSTLNPKQKLALAKQLNLRPRQVEVWFQNRRARTKLKQTEVDCEYLKRCCETLTEENRRLQKELQELRALKTSQPFYMQLPATTLTMCPSCERVATAGGPAK